MRELFGFIEVSLILISVRVTWVKALLKFKCTPKMNVCMPLHVNISSVTKSSTHLTSPDSF